MSVLPDGLVGRALALAIAALVLTAIYLSVVSPVFVFYSDRAERLQGRSKTAQRYTVLARDLHVLRAAEKTWRDQSGGELLLAGTSDALATAALQSQMKGLVEDAGAKLTSAEILPARAEGNFRRVGIRVVFSGDLKLVTAVLRGMETGRPVLSAGDFDIHAGDGSDDANTGDGLAVTLEVYGFRSGRETSG